MLLRYFYDQKLAQASYMVGCAATGEALIITACTRFPRKAWTAAGPPVVTDHN